MLPFSLTAIGICNDFYAWLPNEDDRRCSPVSLLRWRAIEIERSPYSHWPKLQCIFSLKMLGSCPSPLGSARPRCVRFAQVACRTHLTPPLGHTCMGQSRPVTTGSSWPILLKKSCRVFFPMKRTLPTLKSGSARKRSCPSFYVATPKHRPGMSTGPGVVHAA